jgi:uncharacterized DUF497 family protein
MASDWLRLVRYDSDFPGVSFEWDPRKNQANIRKHKISFETASLVFYDPDIYYRSDEEHSDLEQRDIAIGVAGNSRVLFVVNTIRGAEQQEIIRIISARPATQTERSEYARANGRAET